MQFSDHYFKCDHAVAFPFNKLNTIGSESVSNLDKQSVKKIRGYDEVKIKICTDCRKA